ncbi:MAG: flavin reductase family protein [Brevinematia bacterium]
MLRKSDKGFYSFFPSVVCVIVTSFQGRTNAMPAAWTTISSINPRYFSVMISKRRFTYELLSRSKSFSVNFLDWKHLDIVDKLGFYSGRDVDKIEKFNIPLERGILDGVFYIPLSFAVYECKLVKDEEVGDHNLIVGEVMNVLVDDDVFDSSGNYIPDKVSPILYVAGEGYIKLRILRDF